MSTIKTILLAGLIALAACTEKPLPPHSIESKTDDKIVLVSHDPKLDHKTAEAILNNYSCQAEYQVVLKKPAPDGILKPYAALNLKCYDDSRLEFVDVLFQ